jgi:hypothetical protein
LPVIPLLLVGLTIWQIPRGSTMPLQTTEYAAEGKFGELVDAAGLNEPEVYLRDEDLTKPFLRSIKRLNEVACETINSRMRRLVELRSARSESDRSPAAVSEHYILLRRAIGKVSPKEMQKTRFHLSQPASIGIL